MKKVFKVVRLAYKHSLNSNNLGFGAQILEMSILRVLHGIGPNYYLTAGFFEKDIPWKLKTSHKSGSAYASWVDSKNPKAYQKISQNKLAETAMLHLMKVPATRYLGFWHSRIGIDKEGNSLTNLAELSTTLSSIKPSAIVLKPLEGHGGYGIRVYDIDFEEDDIYLRDRKSGEELCLSSPNTSLDELLERTHGWIVEEYFVQHPTLSKINGSSVNTIRMWVQQCDEQSSPKCIAGYLRIGREGSVVDNQSSGGIVCPIEMESGMLREVQSGTPERHLYTHHPDHGAAIEGLTIPHWLECQRLAERALDVFPHLNFCGLDIAIGKDGPVIVELNPSPDKEGAAFMQIPFPQ